MKNSRVAVFFVCYSRANSHFIIYDSQSSRRYEKCAPQTLICRLELQCKWVSLTRFTWAVYRRSLSLFLTHPSLSFFSSSSTPSFENTRLQMQTINEKYWENEICIQETKLSWFQCELFSRFSACVCFIFFLDLTSLFFNTKKFIKSMCGGWITGGVFSAF